MERDDSPPWTRFLPDPQPPTIHEVNAKLREGAPSVQQAIGVLIEQHEALRKNRALLALVLRLFDAIVENLPSEDARTLFPLDSARANPVRRQRAIDLLTRSRNWRSRSDHRVTFGWDYESVYEFSDSILNRATSPRSPAGVRKASRAVYRLFVCIALRLSELYEHHWVIRRRRARAA